MYYELIEVESLSKSVKTKNYRGKSWQKGRLGHIFDTPRSRSLPPTNHAVCAIGCDRNFVEAEKAQAQICNDIVRRYWSKIRAHSATLDVSMCREECSYGLSNAREPLLFPIDLLRGYCTRLSYDMSVQARVSESPMHVALTPRFQGMCPLGHQEDITFEKS